MEKIETATPDITEENIERIIGLFPQVATEVESSEGELERTIDFDALRDLLGDVAEGQRERYQFTWPGKREAKAEARRPINKTMIPCPEKSVDWDTTENLYIEGDNLDALKLLKETYAGKIKLIYIDPPYNTGHEFLYEDDASVDESTFIGESGEYDEDRRRLVANPSTSGRFHSRWCSNMYERLLLARDLLSSDGAIFISIDDNESYNLRKICNEVFGESCFVGDVAWQRSYSPRNDAKGIPAEVEHMVAYSKQPEWNPKKLPRTESMNAGYGSPDGDSKLWASGDPAAPGAVTHQGMVYGIQHPMTGEMMYPPTSSHWRIGQPGLLEILNEWAPYELRDLHDAAERAKVCGISPEEVREGVKGIVLSVPFAEAAEKARKRYDQGSWPLLYFTGNGMGGMRRKRYLDESSGRTVTNLWTYDEVGHTDEAKKELKKLFDGNAPFDTPKPTRLMKRVLDIASDEDTLVLDFFSGSASMADAVMQKNAEDGGYRKFILVQINEPQSGDYADLCEIGEERIRRAGEKIVGEVESENQQLKLGEDPRSLPDVGFRVLRIDTSNFKGTYATPDATDQGSLLDLIDNVKEGRSAEDILFQVLPAFRIPYSAHVETLDIHGKKVFDVNHGQLLACFDADVTNDVIEEIARRKPSYAVMRDLSFKDDSASANFEELFKTFSPDTIRRVI